MTSELWKTDNDVKKKLSTFCALKYKLIGKSIHRFKWDILGDFQTV